MSVDHEMELDCDMQVVDPEHIVRDFPEVAGCFESILVDIHPPLVETIMGNRVESMLDVVLRPGEAYCCEAK
jgi:hypothetical protein